MNPEEEFRGSSLCVVGNINRDIKIAPLPAGDYLFRDGETSVSSVIETIGGGGANSAFAAAALGANVTFLGKAGADGLGDRLERTMRLHGVRGRLARDERFSSGTSVALSFDNGHRHFVSSLPANESLSLADLDLASLAGHDHLLRADVWFSKPMLFEGNRELFQAARQAGLAVSLDLNWDPKWNHAPAGEIVERKNAVRATLPWVTLAHGNARELKEFADAPDLDTALKRICDWGAEAVVVHLGADGAGFHRGGPLLVEPPAPVKATVNNTGCGDVLSVCMMLLHGKREIAERLRLSNAIVARFMEGRLKLIPELAD